MTIAAITTVGEIAQPIPHDHSTPPGCSDLPAGQFVLAPALSSPGLDSPPPRESPGRRYPPGSPAPRASSFLTRVVRNCSLSARVRAAENAFDVGGRNKPSVSGTIPSTSRNCREGNALSSGNPGGTRPPSAPHSPPWRPRKQLRSESDDQKCNRAASAGTLAEHQMAGRASPYRAHRRLVSPIVPSIIHAPRKNVPFPPP